MANVSKSKLLAGLKRNAKGAHKKLKDKEVEVRASSSLPPNLREFVFSVKKAEFKETKKGDPMCIFQGVVVEDTLGTGKIEHVGAQFNHMHMFNSWTPKKGQAGTAVTVQDRIDRFYNDLKILGFEKEVKKASDIDDCIEIWEGLEGNGYYIASTGGLRPGGEPYLNLVGPAPKDYEPPTAEGSAQKVDDDEEEEDDEEEVEDDDEEVEDDEEEVEDDDEEVEDDEEEVEEEYEFTPEKDEVYNWNKPDGKELEVLVVSIDEKKMTVKAKNASTKRTISSPIPWDELEEFEDE